MSSPMISVAGVRAIIGDSLIPEEFVKFTAAFTSTLPRKMVVLGGDTRPSRHMLRHLVMGACMATGCRVIDLGICPTPTIGFMTRLLGAGGGIGITASHNPLQWNALKFFSSQGVFLVSDEFNQIMERYRSASFDYQPYDKLGSVEVCADPIGPHLDKVLAAVDIDRIRAAQFNVAIDFCNGAGITLISRLLVRLGCRVIPLFDDPGRAFERTAEPLPENITALCDLVRREKADIGFAIDPDADRLALVDEKGRAIGEERTLTLAARAVLQRAPQPTPIVANLSTTRALDDVAAEFGTRVERTRIGEANVVERILATGALIGGEGNGGVIYPAIHPGRDAATGIALLLDAMAAQGKSIGALNREVPDYAMVKEKIGIEGMNVLDILARLKRDLASETVELSEIDGLKISLSNAWVHVRPSGTEPILRVFTEAPTVEEAKSLAQRAMNIVRAG